MTPTQRSLAEMRKRGYLCEVVEDWNGFTRRRHDLWGCIDILCLRGSETVAVQTTSRANMSARVKKIAEAEATPYMREAGWTILVHGWRRGSNGRWELKETDVS